MIRVFRLAMLAVCIMACLPSGLTSLAEDDVSSWDASPAPVSSGVNSPGGPEQDALMGVEQAIFSTTYPADPVEIRLARLERAILGDVQSGSLLERQARLLQLMQPVAPPVLEPSGLSNGNPKPGRRIDVDLSLPEAVNEGDSGDYPAVTALEQFVFHQTFEKQDLTERLSRLENTAFGESASELSLAERVDRLQDYYPNAPGAAPERPLIDSTALRRLPTNAHAYDGASLDVYTQLAALEQKMNEKPVKMDDLMITDRLNRLELKVFGHTYPEDLVTARIHRLSQSFEVRAVQPTHEAIDAVSPDQSGFSTWDGPPIQHYNYTQLSAAEQKALDVRNTASPLSPADFVGNPVFFQQLNAVEANVLGHVDAHAPLRDRLSALETVVLGYTQDNMTNEDRLNQIFQTWRKQQASQALGSQRQSPGIFIKHSFKPNFIQK